ncbi:MAG: DUF4124 domain-containing protein [Gallionella sp.]|nr:DUF4124 domain-containing protein [Gallionella sp.]
MKLRFLLAALSLLPLTGQAEIYKTIDADGHVTYSSSPTKGSKKIFLEPLPTMAPPSAAPQRGRSASSPTDFPKVNGDTQKGRDETRRKILQDELDVEIKLLAEAQTNLKDGADNPEVFRNKDGGTSRNMAKYDEKIKALTEQVSLHQSNIEALNTELSKLK